MTTGKRSWSDYLDAVESAALAVQERLEAGGTPSMVEVDRPTCAPTAADEPRRLAVAALVGDVTALLGMHMDAVRDRLSALTRHPVRASASQQLGERLDLLG